MTVYVCLRLLGLGAQQFRPCDCDGHIAEQALPRAGALEAFSYSSAASKVHFCRKEWHYCDRESCQSPRTFQASRSDKRLRLSMFLAHPGARPARPRKSGCGSQTKMQGPSSRLRCKSLRSSTSTTRWQAVACKRPFLPYASGALVVSTLQVGKACPKLPQHLPIRLATGPHEAVLARVNEVPCSAGLIKFLPIFLLF